MDPDISPNVDSNPIDTITNSNISKPEQTINPNSQTTKQDNI
jgi:hypothetical protein